MGKFVHEAAAVDPVSGYVYLTEDEDRGRFYRFRPAAFGDLAAGVLEAAFVAASGDVIWVAVPSTKPYRGRDTTSFARGEGAWFDAGRQTVFFTTTTDSRVWAFNTGTNVMAMVYDAADGGPLREPDNITVHAPSGLVFVAEDSDDLQLVLLSEQGDEWIASPFLQLEGHDSSEIAGPAFSPEHKALLQLSAGDRRQDRHDIRGHRAVLNAPGSTFLEPCPFRRSSRARYPALSSWLRRAATIAALSPPRRGPRRDGMTGSFVGGFTLCIVAATAMMSAQNWRGKGPDEPAPLVLGHRGASAYLPEHTLASYQLAIEQGADYIEPDLVSTRDGVLIARHEVNISGTTDVAAHPEFAGRFTTKTIDGVAEQGWFADDFTLTEIKTLRATQRVAFRAQQYNGLYQIPTFSEVIELAKRARREKGREVGVYPETKHPTYHRGRGLPLEPKLLAVLRAHGWDRSHSPVFIQSFEVSNLKQLSHQTDVRLVQLIDGYDTLPDGSIDVDRVNFRPFDASYDFTAAGDPRRYVDLATPAGLAEIASYADGVGPWKRYIVGARVIDADHDGQPDDVNGDGRINDADKTAVRTTLIADAHRAGLFVHTWTFRNEPSQYLLSDYGEQPTQEFLEFFCMRIDGVFADSPDTAATSRILFWQSSGASCRPLNR
jgi:glycerophosphoryl diester phosphodiesterase